MAIKQTQSLEKRPLGRMQDKKKEKQEYFDLNSCVELLDVKSIIDNRQAYIQLVDYGYLQLISVFNYVIYHVVRHLQLCLIV